LATADGSPFTVTVTGNPGDPTILTASFTVVPNLAVTPANGVFGAVVSVTGNGFGSKATTCTLTSAPTVLFAAGTSSCSIVTPGPNGNGAVSGTFTVATAIPAGTYTVTATDNSPSPGPFAASVTFTVGSPTAQVTLTPNVIAAPLSGSVAVGISGFGFNGADTACAVTVSAPITGTCTISGGTAGGSVNVPSGTPPGFYLVTVTGTTYGDFASNYLEVAFLTGTLTSITTTSTTSTSSTTYTTLTTSTSQSISSTTFTFTGIKSLVSYTLTTQTFTGVSTAASVSVTTEIITSVQGTVTTVVTTVSTLGQLIQPVFASNQTAYDAVGLIGVLMLLGTVFLRRLFF